MKIRTQKKTCAEVGKLTAQVKRKTPFISVFLYSIIANILLNFRMEQRLRR